MDTTIDMSVIRARLETMGVCALAAALLLSGCSRSASGPADAASSVRSSHLSQDGRNRRAPNEAELAPAPDPTEDMVSAVGPNGATGPVKVKFRLAGKPMLGMPLQVDLAIIPSADVQISHIHGSLLPDDGLLLQSERSFDVTDLTAGTAVQRRVTVVPQQPGVLNLNATITVGLDTSSLSSTFSIPLIVSDNST